MPLDMLKFTRDHEWLRLDGAIATVGITAHAQKALGAFVHVRLPHVGSRFEQGVAVVNLESVKTASEVYAPVSGQIVEVNTRLATEPGLINADPTGEGWLFKMKVVDTSQVIALLDHQAVSGSSA
jgi:glycine cleavage system H protein